jgi:hypothetical protein
VFSDRKIPEPDGQGQIAYYTADVVSYSDYYPFGMQLDGRNGNGSEYRYGAANGQEIVNEISGEGNHYTAEYWEYNPRLGKRWNPDPVVKYHESPYATFANNPIWFVDPNGADSANVNGVWKWNTEPRDSYSKISSRTGVSVGNLRSWNKYGDKSIPTGADLNLSDLNRTIGLGEDVGALHITLTGREYGLVGQNTYNNFDRYYGVMVGMEFVPTNTDGTPNYVQTVESNIDQRSLYNSDTGPSNTPLLSSPQWFSDPMSNSPNDPINIPTLFNGMRYFSSDVFQREKGRLGVFGDTPGRPYHPSGNVYFQAELSFVLDRGNGFERMASFTWGYTLFQNGKYGINGITLNNDPSFRHLEVIQQIRHSKPVIICQ